MAGRRKASKGRQAEALTHGGAVRRRMRAAMNVRLYTKAEREGLRAMPKRVTNPAIAAGGKPEREAEETDRYGTLEGALACLVEDFSLSGIAAEHDQPKLV